MSPALARRYVYDGAQRLLHWWIALAILALAASGLVAGELEAGEARALVWDLHMTAGMLLAVGFAGRVAWGVFGTPHARFAALVFPGHWLAALRRPRLQSADGAYGHHPQAALGYLGLYALVLVMIGSGLVLAAALHGRGPLAAALLDELEGLPLVQEVHEYAWWAIAAFAAVHVAALILHERRDGIPLAQSMISGYQYRTAGADAGVEREEHESV